MGYLKKYIKKYYRLFLLAMLFLSLEALCDLLQPMVMSRIVDNGVRGRDLAYVLHAGALMVGITAVGAVGAVVRNNISSRVSQWFGTELRADLFRKIQSLSFRSADAFDTASLVTRLTNDVTQMQNFVNGMMRIFVKSPLLCIGSIVLSVILEPRLSLVIAVLVPLIVVIIYFNNRIGYPFFRRVQRAVDGLNGVMREFLSGVRVVKAFNRAEYEKERFSRSNEGLAGVQTTAMRVTSVFSPVMMLTVNLGIVCVLWLGGYAVNAGSVQVGKIIAFINYMTQMANSLMMISNVFTMFVRARASSERIGEVMAVPGEAMGGGGPAAPARAAGVEMRHVTFSYSGRRETAALRDVSFSVGPGMTLGIIGTTGSGKTTLVSLIPRFYEAMEGQVLVDGEDVRTADIRALRARIGMVPQKNVLFSGTVADNIRWGRRDATREEVIRAAQIAQIHDSIVARPQGYDTLLGQGGVNLSGGQKQRVAIARALVRRPAILILDDCTSAVDAVTERKIREGLREYSESLLCITIAQRIASVMDSDRILVLDDGAVCGLGTHEELLRSCRVYREIALSQFGKAGEADG